MENYNYDNSTASGLSRKELEAIGRGATIETIDSILAQYPYFYDQGEILDGFRTNEYAYRLYNERKQKEFREEMQATREKNGRRWFWIFALTSPFWLAALGFGVYQFADVIKRYPLQICAVCAILITIKVVLGGKD